MTVQVQRRGAVTTIVLDRPDAMNAVNAALAEELLQAVQTASEDESRAVVLTGAGRAFCSGADLKGGGITLGEDNLPDLGKGLRDGIHPVIEGIRTMPKPVVASVNGPAVGVGLSFALACDLVIAAESAYFLLAFVNIGLAPDGGSSFLLPERIGFTRAAEMALLGERIPAERALDWGLVNQVVPDSELTPTADALADKLAAGPTRSYAASKRQLNAWQFARLAEQLELEASLQSELGRSPDFFEGVTAFVEKRPANFSGS